MSNVSVSHVRGIILFMDHNIHLSELDARLDQWTVARSFIKSGHNYRTTLTFPDNLIVRREIR